jgi:hypothetical protein
MQSYPQLPSLLGNYDKTDRTITGSPIGGDIEYLNLEPSTSSLMYGLACSFQNLRTSRITPTLKSEKEQEMTEHNLTLKVQRIVYKYITESGKGRITSKGTTSIDKVTFRDVCSDAAVFKKFPINALREHTFIDGQGREFSLDDLVNLWMSKPDQQGNTRVNIYKWRPFFGKRKTNKATEAPRKDNKARVTVKTTPTKDETPKQPVLSGASPTEKIEEIAPEQQEMTRELIANMFAGGARMVVVGIK